MATNKNSKQPESSIVSNPALSHVSCGYRILNSEEKDPKYKCIYCELIMKEPTQLTECGHRCCRGCIEVRIAVAPDQILICPVHDCHTEFMKEQIMPDRAFKRELDALPVTCIYAKDKECDWNGPLKAYQEHLDTAHISYVCSHCQSSFASAELLSKHQLANCDGRFKKCELGSVCTDEMLPTDQYDAHLLSLKHQQTLILMLNGQYDPPETSEQDQAMESSSPNDELEQQIGERLTSLAEKVQKLNDETVDLSRDFLKLNELCQVSVQEVNNFQSAVSERSIAMSNLQPKQEIIQKEIEQLKQNFEENQYISTDGSLTWKVDRVAERMADAQSERQPSIYSPIFYSSPNGYKMRARLYLHGDGNARRTHMSLFFLLMKGDYDGLLTWPFSHKVTFCLFDQTGNNRHIIDSFRPDVKSNSFQRPKTEANIASGIPKFFPLPMIQQDDNPYVRDDTLYLKILVDLNDTPKLVLPFMLTLNPGLPYHVQQVLINQEKLKHQNTANASATSTVTSMTTS